MEVYLVKEEVKIIEVSEAFSQTKRFNSYIKNLETEDERMRIKREDEDSCDNGDSSDSDDSKGSDDSRDGYGDPDSDGDDSSDSQENEPDRTLLTISNLPVVTRSICSNVDVHAREHAQRFATKVEMSLSKKEINFELEDMKFELVISNDPNSRDGYLRLSTKSVDGSKINVFKRLNEEIDVANVEFSVQFSMCRLPTENSPVSPKSLVTFKCKEEQMFYCVRSHRVGCDSPLQIPRKILEWSEQGTGFIYSKTSFKISLNEKGVDLVYGYLDGNMRMLKDRDFTDVEIGCGGGSREIVRCHRVFLVDKSPVLRDKFKKMLKEDKRKMMEGHWKLEMARMSKKGVETFLEYIYCGRVSGALGGCDVALELLIAAREYKVVELENAMGGIIMAKESSDFDYFSVKGGLNLFLYGRKNGNQLKYLRDKGVRVLQSYLKTASDKILESKEYQNLFENQQKVAMELSSLYIQLSS